MVEKRRRYYHVNPCWNVQSTWKTQFLWRNLKLTKPMKLALRTALDNGVVESATGGTLKALQARDLCQNDGSLTDQGSVMALSLVSLSKQCDHLDLSITDISLGYEGKPELAAMEFLRNENRKICYCEGGAFKLTLYCLCFDRFYRLFQGLWGGMASARSFTYMATGIMSYDFLLEEHPDVHLQMIEDISRTTESEMLRAFDTLKSWQPSDEWAFLDWVGVDREMVQSTFRAVGRDRLVSFAKTFVTDPYAFINGWPDLTCIDGSDIRLIEVKTTDKLHISQLITIPTIVKEADLRVEVMRLRKKPS